MAERRVDMVRLPKQGEVYVREEVLGRDASSVFPTRAPPAGAAAGQQMMGAKRFISQTELDEIRAARGGAEPSAEPLKPLSEVLREAKEAKQAAFDNQWKTMKTGKNRPLDPDELEFLDNLADAEAARERASRLTDAAEVEEFRKMLEEQAAAKAAAEAEAEAKAHAKAAPLAKAVLGPTAKPEPKKQLPKPTVVLKPRSAAPPSAPSTTAPKASSSQQQPIAAGSSAGPEADARSAKRAKLEEGQGLGGSAGGGSGQGGEEGLAGLLGSYGSDSDDS